MTTMPMAIDAVITWVDGADPAHQRRLAEMLGEHHARPPSSADRTRFNDAGEIDYCLASIFRFAPWLRKIHIVTDGQTPDAVRRLAGSPLAGRIAMVDHRSIFAGFEQHLPTFNSRSIITMLWRIPELADQFVYFNDDMMLLRDTSAEDFFQNGNPVLRGEWRKQRGRGWIWKVRSLVRRLRGRDAEHAGNLDSQQLSARIAGFNDRYYRLFHNPFPMRRSVLHAFFTAHPQRLEKNASYKLRSAEQFKTESVATHLHIASGEAVLDNRLHVVQLKPSEQSLLRVRAKMSRADSDSTAAFVCVQSLELAPEAVQSEILAWLDRRIGRLSVGD